MPHRNQLLQLVAQSRRLQRIEDQLPAHRRKRTRNRGHPGMGHDCGSHRAILLAHHQFAIPDDLVEYPALRLDNTEVRTPLRLLYLVRRLCCYTCAYSKLTPASV